MAVFAPYGYGFGAGFGVPAVGLGFPGVGLGFPDAYGVDYNFGIPTFTPAPLPRYRRPRSLVLPYRNQPAWRQFYDPPAPLGLGARLNFWRFRRTGLYENEPYYLGLPFGYGYGYGAYGYGGYPGYAGPYPFNEGSGYGCGSSYGC